MHGLTLEQWQMLYKVFASFQNRLQWVKLFGSRARGDYKEASDIDLAIGMTEDIVTDLTIALEQSQLPYTFDIIDYNHQPNQKLKEAIDRDGILLWAKKGDGSIVMTNEILQLKREEYHKALTRLQSALQKEPDDDDMVLDATIQRFEFTFELAWKLLKALLDYEGIEANSPRSCIREAWKQHLIKNAEQWLDMQTKRNLSSHTYNEATALEIYRSIKEKYIDLLTELDQTVEATLTNVGADR